MRVIVWAGELEEGRAMVHNEEEVILVAEADAEE